MKQANAVGIPLQAGGNGVRLLSSLTQKKLTSSYSMVWCGINFVSTNEASREKRKVSMPFTLSRVPP